MADIPEVLKDLIQEDIRCKKEARNGTLYYGNVNEILKHDFRKYYVDTVPFIDYNKANNHIANNFHKKLVDQKTGYIAGKPIVITSEDKQLEEKVNELLGEQSSDIFNEWIKGASNRGWEGIHAYINLAGEFRYTNISNLELIFIYDTSYERELINVIRYYKMTWQREGKDETTIRVEVWDAEKVTYYQEIDEDFIFITPGTMGIEFNPCPHWWNMNTATNQTQEANWGKIPFIKLQNNTEEMTDLEPIKSYIDALDMVSSGFVNDLRDIQLAIWVLKGYEGEKLSDFMHNLQTFKAIKLSADESSSAEPKTMEIPKEARQALLAWLESKIYQIGQGVDESNISGGSVTNVVIKALYSGLDIKSNLLITKLKSALSEFMYFVVTYINNRDKTSYNYKDLKFTFNKSMIFNQVEIVDMIQKSFGIISKKTLIANHPFVDNLEDELAQLEEEEKAIINGMESNLDNPIPKPKAEEKEQDFMNRCMSFLISEGMKRDQAFKICQAQWSN
ncbi:MAG: phage portal protein [Candidatus Heimdallarchaeaceae archaeon]